MITDKSILIMEVALRLISENGFHGTPMSLIAKEADIGVGTIYRYFDSKEALINSLYRYCKQSSGQAMQVALDDSLSMPAQFRNVWINLAHYYIAHPTVFKFTEQYAHSPFITADTKISIADQYAPLRTFLATAQSQDIIKPLPYNTIFSLCYGTFFFIARRHIYEQVEATEELLAQAADACWDGLKR